MASGTPVAVINSDFSQNEGRRPDSPIGWTAVPASSGSFYYFGSGPPYAFSFGAIDGIDDTVSQSISIAPGCCYAVSYFLTSSDTAHFLPTIDGAVLRDSSGASLEIDDTNPSLNPGTPGQTQFTGYFTTTSASVELSFAGARVQDYCDLQDILVTVF